MSTERDEDALIAGVITMPSLFPKVSYVEPIDFQATFHQACWSAIQKAVLGSTVMTPETIATLDPNLNAERIRKLCESHGVNPERTVNAARAVVDKKRANRAIELLTRTAAATRAALEGKFKPQEDSGLAADASWQAIVSHAALDAIKMTSTSDAVDAAALRDEVVSKIGKGRTCYPTGITEIDDFFGGGLIPGTVIAVGAQTKAGKTIFANTLSYNLEIGCVQHATLTLERHQGELEKIKVARSMTLASRDLDTLDLAAHDDGIDPWDRPLVGRRYCNYFHKPGMTLDDVRAHVMHQAIARDAKVVIIDYWQLIGGRGRDNVDVHLTKVAQVIQTLATELNLSIVVMVQLTDFGVPKDCGAIKQACNTYLVLHRDKGSNVAWLETQANNLGPEHNIGQHDEPCMIIDRKVGPHFRDLRDGDQPNDL